MAIQTIDGFEIKAPLSIDNRYGPFADTTEANNVILSFYRYIGLTVLLTGNGTQIEYWYNPTIADEDLVPKGAALSISGSDGQVVFFSGSTALSGSPSFIFNYTSSTPTFNVSGAISASYGPGTVGFYGTASWALNASTASFITGAGVFGPFGSNSVLSASYALHGGDVTKIIAGTNITIDPPEGTGSVTINASAAAGSGVAVTATASFTNLSTWNFTHNLQNRYVIIQALDVNHNQIIPENITLVDSSSAVLTFPTLESGYAVASIGGVTSSFSLTSSAVITNFGGQIYDLNNNLVIQPTDILIISGNMSVNGSAIINGNLVPGGPYSANISNYNIGTSTTRWNNLYVGNQIYLGTLGDSAYIDYDNGHIISDKPFSGSFTGSLFGTSSWAINALTASYVNPLHQDVILTGSILLSGTSSANITASIQGVSFLDFVVLPNTITPTHQEGRLHWLDDTKTLQIDTDVNGFMLEVGHQSVVRARNTTGFNLAAGKVVYINGESGNRPTITTASWDGDPTSASTLGFVAQQINDNQTGYVVTNGILRGINTNAFPPGTQLYLSSSGDYTSTIPVSPKHEVRLGKTVTQATSGVIYVDIMNGYELGELHDVLFNSSTDGDLVVKSGSLWINSKQLTGSYGLTGSLSLTNGDVTASIFAATNNGNGTNFKVGDDAWIGDINTADTLQIRGQQNGGKGYIKFGTGSSNPILGSGGTSTLELTGSLNISSSLIMPNRHAFSVYGSGTTSNLTTTQNTDGTLNSNNFAVSYTQGSGFDSSTGIFTAPIAGLYQVTLVGRNSGYSSGISQLAVLKNNSNAAGNVLMIEWASSSTMNHTGGGMIFKLAVNDTLRLRVLAGQINFDGNDNWSVAYIG